jgi:hypothetical protein
MLYIITVSYTCHEINGLKEGFSPQAAAAPGFWT